MRPRLSIVLDEIEGRLATLAGPNFRGIRGPAFPEEKVDGYKQAVLGLIHESSAADPQALARRLGAIGPSVASKLLEKRDAGGGRVTWDQLLEIEDVTDQDLWYWIHLQEMAERKRLAFGTGDGFPDPELDPLRPTYDNSADLIMGRVSAESFAGIEKRLSGDGGRRELIRDLRRAGYLEPDEVARGSTGVDASYVITRKFVELKRFGKFDLPGEGGRAYRRSLRKRIYRILAKSLETYAVSRTKIRLPAGVTLEQAMSAINEEDWPAVWWGRSRLLGVLPRSGRGPRLLTPFLRSLGPWKSASRRDDGKLDTFNLHPLGWPNVFFNVLTLTLEDGYEEDYASFNVATSFEGRIKVVMIPRDGGGIDVYMDWVAVRPKTPGPRGWAIMTALMHHAGMVSEIDGDWNEAPAPFRWKLAQWGFHHWLVTGTPLGYPGLIEFLARNIEDPVERQRALENIRAWNG